jgi:hypothetical protein
MTAAYIFGVWQAVHRVETEVLEVLEGHHVLPNYPPGSPSHSPDVLQPGEAPIWVWLRSGSNNPPGFRASGFEGCLGYVACVFGMLFGLLAG